MSRRAFLKACLAAALGAGFPAAASAAAAFQPTRISVAVRGSGPDVVLIPGLGAGRSVWGSTVAAMPGYRYHLVQIGGFAGEPVGGNRDGKVAAAVAYEVARYIAANKLKRPAIVGHSMGGSIALMMAARYPSVAGKVMVVDMVPAPVQLFGLPMPAAKPLAGLLRREIAGTATLRAHMKWAVGKFGSTDWLDSRTDAGVVGRSLEELMVTDLTPEIARIKAPLTVVYACPEPVRLTRGALDRLYRRAYAERPGTKLIRIERSGHTVMADQPHVFRKALRDFLGG